MQCHFAFGWYQKRPIVNLFNSYFKQNSAWNQSYSTWFTTPWKLLLVQTRTVQALLLETEVHINLMNFHCKLLGIVSYHLRSWFWHLPRIINNQRNMSQCLPHLPYSQFSILFNCASALWLYLLLSQHMQPLFSHIPCKAKQLPFSPIIFWAFSFAPGQFWQALLSIAI